MAYQCIKYRLTADGAIPDFLYLGDDGVGGCFSVPDSTPWPRNVLMVGISEDGATGDFETVPSKDELYAYLELNKNVIFPEVSDPTDENLPAIFPANATEAANWVWGCLESLNA
jgi:hypothetical protein